MASKRMTPKFDGATTCPDKQGVYPVEAPDLIGTFYSFWNGEFWGWRCATPTSAGFEGNRHNRALGPVTRWWGFKERQK